MRTLLFLLACVTTAPIPTPVGFGPRYQLPAATPRSISACTTARARVASHVELFANRKVLLIPAGVGAPRRGCSPAVRTETPTGVVESVPGSTLADLFAVWGQPLSPRGFASFHGPVHAWVGGCPWRGDVRRIPLAHHAEIVVELGGYVPPHRSFLFP